MLFENQPDHHFFYLLGNIWETSRRRAEAKLKSLNMTWPQFAALTVLVNTKNVNQHGFAMAAGIDTTTAMVLCDSLEKRAWLKRMADPGDRRVNRLVLTDDGKLSFKQAYGVVHSEFAVLLKGITQKDLSIAVRALEAVQTKMNG